MMPAEPTIHAFVLAKNEQANIGRCLAALDMLELPTTVLDSGSTDGTRHIVASFQHAVSAPFDYENHCAAYNRITGELAGSAEYALILDADMIVSPTLLDEFNRIVTSRRADVVITPIDMWWEGRRLAHGSLYPPKPVLFRVGAEYFVPSGHGERLIATESAIATTTAKLIHDDRKGFQSFLHSQLRYADNMIARARERKLTWKDTIYLRTPLVLLLQPLYSYVIKGGIRAGRIGAVYALDRLIVASIVLRQSLASMLGKQP